MYLIHVSCLQDFLREWFCCAELILPSCTDLYKIPWPSVTCLARFALKDGTKTQSSFCTHKGSLMMGLSGPVGINEEIFGGGIEALFHFL